MKGNPLRRILGSSKALVVLLIVALAFVSLYQGKASWSDVESLLRWIVGPWLGAVGLEDAAKHVADGMRSKDQPWLRATEERRDP